MKKTFLLLVLSGLILALGATTVAEWNFDSDSILPSVGSGTLTLTGGVTSDGFNTGNPGRAWSTTSYPAQGTNNRTAGLLIEVSTLGYTAVSFSWNIRHSNTSANREVLYYTLDKTATEPAWVEAGTYNASSGDAWLASSYDGSAVTGLANNANLAFKIVSSFADDANTVYMPSNPGSTYAGGKWRFDNLVVSGTALSPSLQINAALDTFYAQVGATSPVQSYAIEGVNLTANLIVTAPQYFFLRVAGETVFSGSLVLQPVAGAIDQTVEAVYQPLASGPHSGNIEHSGGGLAAPQYLAVEGATVKPEPSAYPGNFISSGVNYYQGWLYWTDPTAPVLPDGYLIKGSAVSLEDILAPVDGVAETDGLLVKNVAFGSHSQIIYGLEENAPYYFKIYPFSNAGSAIDYKTDGTAPALTFTTATGPEGSTLLPGDIAFLEYASDSPDRFSFVLLADILENTKIVFTDKAWDGSAFAGSESEYLWRAVGRDYLAGEVIHIVEGIPYDNEGLHAPDFSGFSNSGDQIIALQGSLAEPSFLAAFSTYNWISGGTPNNNTSYLPAGLTAGLNALAFDSEIDDGVYNGTTTGTAAELRAALNDPANWIRNNNLSNITYPDWSVSVILAPPEPGISYLGSGVFRIGWPAVEGALWYALYSSADPGAEFPEAWEPLNSYVDDTHLDCYYATEPPAQFYRVVAHK